MHIRVYVHHQLVFVLGLVYTAGWPFASASASPSSDSSSGGGATTRKMYDISYRHVYRQLAPAPAPTISSYNYWWPYPPQTPAAPPSVIPTTSTTPALLPSSDTTSTETDSPTTSTSTSSTSASNSSSSTSTSMSMTTLTPGPPQTTSPIPSIKSLPQNDPKAGFKIVYILVPLFALLGVILGSVAAWLVYGCLTRKLRMRQAFGVDDKGIGGPRYMPAEEVIGVGRDVDVENGRYPGPMMQEMDMKTEEEGIAQFRWPGVPSSRGQLVGERGRGHGHEHGEDDPFLLHPSTQHKSKPRSSKSTRSVMSNATSLAFLEFYESDEEALEDETREKMGMGKKKGREDDVPWESLRHKSIKRGILERVRKEAGWVDSLRGVVGSSFSQLSAGNLDTGSKNGNAKKRHTHVRGDSDLRIEDLSGHGGGVSIPDKVRVCAESKCVDDVEASSRSKSGKRPLLQTFDSGVTSTTTNTTRANGRISASRANSSQTAYSGLSSAGKGFRILAESPLPHPPPLHSHASHTSVDSSYWWWGEASADIDRYTAVPARICRSRSQSRSRSTSPVKGVVAQWPLAQARDVLPQSPPRIMSPMLEDSLCFTPNPGPGRSVALTPTPLPRSGGARVHAKEGEKGKGRGGRLRSPRPSSLPFPRDPDMYRGLLNSPRQAEDVYRGRLVKQQSPASRKTTGTGLSRDKTLPGPPGGGGREGDRDGDRALKKVGDIVRQSWSAREVQLVDGVKSRPGSMSPMQFGRRV